MRRRVWEGQVGDNEQCEKKKKRISLNREKKKSIVHASRGNEIIMRVFLSTKLRKDEARIPCKDSQMSSPADPSKD